MNFSHLTGFPQFLSGIAILDPGLFSSKTCNAYDIRDWSMHSGDESRAKKAEQNRWVVLRRQSRREKECRETA